MEYVTGLRFVFKSDKSDAIGYIIPSKEIYINIEDTELGISGFKLAVTSRGICAIACITGSGKTTEWVGSPDNLPRMLLIGEGTLHCLRGTFDVS
jgi:hypothetical protein